VALLYQAVLKILCLVLSHQLFMVLGRKHVDKNRVRQ